MAEKNSAEQKSQAVNDTNEKSSGGESLEDLLSTLSKQINSSDWLKHNTPEKFAEENPEVAQAFEQVTKEKSEGGADTPSKS